MWSPVRVCRNKLLLVATSLALCSLCLIFFQQRRLQDQFPSGQAGNTRKLKAHHAAQGVSQGTGQRGDLPPSTTPIWHNPLYAQRRQRAFNVCSKLREGGVAKLTRYNSTSYCVVPKVGCTFWLSVFRFLHGDTGGKNYSSPFLIPRHVIHYGARKNMRFYSTNASAAPGHLTDDLRFMFVREPYARLWSAYVDKFLLIDYWQTEGKNIVKKRTAKTNKTACAHDISFEEFLNFVVNVKKPSLLNEHWRPIQYQCSPCLFNPHIIGKIETFSSDSRYILHLMNVSWILDHVDHERHVYHEMEMLINYNWRLLKSRHYINCTNNVDLAKRLWNTFQINGYLPTEARLPADCLHSALNASGFRQAVFQAYKKRPAKSSAAWSKQREEAMLGAYSDIPDHIMDKLQLLYQNDFDMLGYESRPSALFSHRTAGNAATELS